MDLSKIRVSIGGMLAVIGFETSAAEQDEFVSARTRMVEQHLATRDIRDERVLAAMRKVPRHRFVPASEQRYAYADTPLPIVEGRTISQPCIVALITQLARPTENDIALEVGTGPPHLRSNLRAHRAREPKAAHAC